MSKRVINSAADLQNALDVIGPMFDNPQPVLGTPEGDYFDFLANAISAYEEEFYPINWAEDGGNGI